MASRLLRDRNPGYMPAIPVMFGPVSIPFLTYRLPALRRIPRVDSPTRGPISLGGGCLDQTIYRLFDQPLPLGPVDSELH